MENKNKTRWIARTAILIAITVSLQALTLQLGNQYVTGSIVNMMLVLSVMVFGLSTGLTVGAVTPILPTLMGFGPLPPVVPFIMLGNLALISIWHFLGRVKFSKEQANPSVFLENLPFLLALVTGALVKFGILYIGIVKIAAPLILNLPDGHPITVMFSFPQLVTAFLGGIMALFLLPSVRKAIESNRE